MARVQVADAGDPGKGRRVKSGLWLLLRGILDGTRGGRPVRFVEIRQVDGGRLLEEPRADKSRGRLLVRSAVVHAKGADRCTQAASDARSGSKSSHAPQPADAASSRVCCAPQPADAASGRGRCAPQPADTTYKSIAFITHCASGCSCSEHGNVYVPCRCMRRGQCWRWRTFEDVPIRVRGSSLPMRWGQVPTCCLRPVQVGVRKALCIVVLYMYTWCNVPSAVPFQPFANPIDKMFVVLYFSPRACALASACVAPKPPPSPYLPTSTHKPYM